MQKKNTTRRRRNGQTTEEYVKKASGITIRWNRWKWAGEARKISSKNTVLKRGKILNSIKKVIQFFFASIIHQILMCGIYCLMMFSSPLVLKFLFQYWIIRVEPIDNYIEFVFSPFFSILRCFHRKLDIAMVLGGRMRIVNDERHILYDFFFVFKTVCLISEFHYC